MSETNEIQQWKRVNAALLEGERRLTQLLVRYARGETSSEEVDRVTSEVNALRQIADALFEAAFGGGRTD